MEGPPPKKKPFSIQLPKQTYKKKQEHMSLWDTVKGPAPDLKYWALSKQ